MTLVRLLLAVAAFAWLTTASASAAGGDGTLSVLSLEAPTSLAGTWRFQPGDDPAWSSPSHDDRAWPTLRVPGDWGRQGYLGHAGFAWYRLTVRLPAAADRPALAITIGKVHSAYELYAGGRLIGANGRFPPAPSTRYDRELTWPVPAAAIDPDGRLVVALRVWRGSDLARGWQGGPYEGSFLIGTIEQLAAQRWRSRQLPLVLALVYLLVGAYHVHLFRRRRALTEYLWYGLLTIAIGTYAFLVSQWKHDLPLPWLLLKKIEYAVLFLLPALCLQSVWTLLGTQPSHLLRWYQRSFLALAAAAVLSPTLLFLFRTLDIWQIWMLPAAIGLAVLVVWRARERHAEARTVLLGVVLFSLTALNDAAVDMRLLQTPRLVPIGFAAFILSMAVSLANRFTRVFAELEERTLELQRAQADLLRTEKLSAIGRMAAGMVHDLRNPVAAIQSYAMLMSAQSTPEQKQMLQSILDETGRSADMMEDVLAFARGSVRVAPIMMDLGPWLRGVADYLRRDLELSEIDVTLTGDVDGQARLDPARMRRVLCNLAWNARDAMVDGGRFEIAVRRSASGVEIVCTDSGPGLPAEMRDRLFAEFATFGKANGTGLGLALSRSIVLEHGGKIRHEDPAEGGARFVIDLPNDRA